MYNRGNLTITTEDGEIVTYYYGTVSGEKDTGLYPILEDGLLLDNAETVESNAMFYLEDAGTLTVQNNEDAGKDVTMTLADDDSGVTIVSDGRSTVTLGETDTLLQVSVTPSASGSAGITYTNDFGDTVFEVSGTTDSTVSLSAKSGGAEIRFSGYEVATVTVTRDGSITTLDLGTDTYTVALQDDGTVIADSAAHPWRPDRRRQRGRKRFDKARPVRRKNHQLARLSDRISTQKPEIGGAKCAAYVFFTSYNLIFSRARCPVVSLPIPRRAIPVS